VNADIRAYAPSDLTKMAMMGEIDHLPALRHAGEQAERLLRPEIVESLHDVVCHERHGSARLGELVIAGDPQ
jgi:hypothetical protein